MLLFSSWVSLLSSANLDPACLQVELSQDDLMMLLKIPLENLGEASSLGHLSHKQDVSVHLQTSESSSTGISVQIETDKYTNILFKVIHFPFLVIFNVLLASAHVEKSSVNGDEEGDSLETLRFTVNIESLSLVLYGNDPKQVSERF